MGDVTELSFGGVVDDTTGEDLRVIHTRVDTHRLPSLAHKLPLTKGVYAEET